MPEHSRSHPLKWDFFYSRQPPITEFMPSKSIPLSNPSTRNLMRGCMICIMASLLARYMVCSLVRYMACSLRVHMRGVYDARSWGIWHGLPYNIVCVCLRCELTGATARRNTAHWDFLSDTQEKAPYLYLSAFE